MMNTKMICMMGVLLGGLVSQVQAVQVNQRGHGEVLIYPYYTVNNDLNTLYSVVNTTADTKAIKVRFLEGDIGLEVLSFNVYLSAFDVWTGALFSSTSTIADHAGEATAVHVSTDTSCAPFLNKGGQEFLPFAIDTDSDHDNRGMRRATEGHLEIIEMGVLTAAGVAWADHGVSGVPANCGRIQDDWDDNGMWNTSTPDEPSGGLMGAATLVNVAEGMAFSYDAIALQNFWQGPGNHTEPGSPEPDLNAAFPESRVLLDDGEMVVSEWTHGFEAVSAVLTKSGIINEYAIDQGVGGKTEWLLSYPTKGYHSGSDDVIAPFTQTWDGANACETFAVELWNREAYLKPPLSCGSVTCSPTQMLPKMCKSANVISFIAPDGDVMSESRILGSDNLLTISTIDGSNSENGWAKLTFPESAQTDPLSGEAIKGMPVAGIAVMQFTNAGAAEGLLAQYGSLFRHKFVTESIPGEDNDI